MGLASPSWRARLGLAAKLAVSAGVVWYVLGRVDYAGLHASLARATPASLSLAFVAFLLIPPLGGLRWWAALRGLSQPARLSETTVLFSTATVAGQVLPSVAGDAMRVWLLARRGHALPAALRSVLLERVFMLLSLLLLAMATAPLLAARTGVTGPSWAAAALFAAGAAGLGALMAADALPVRHIAWRPWQAMVDGAPQTRNLVLSRWGLLLGVASLTSNLNFVAAAYLLGNALGLPVPLVDFLAVMPAVTLATTMPISLGGWGVREGVLVLLLGRMGVAASDALALSLLMGVFGILCGGPGLLAWCLEGRSMPTARTGVAGLSFAKRYP